MPRKCSVANGKNNYSSEKSKVTKPEHVYQFPTEENKRQLWINVLPNVLSKVSNHMGVCRLHWPEDIEMKSSHSLFPGCPSHFLDKLLRRNQEMWKSVEFAVHKEMPKQTKSMNFLSVMWLFKTWTLFVHSCKKSLKIADFKLFVKVILCDLFNSTTKSSIIQSQSHLRLPFPIGNGIRFSPQGISRICRDFSTSWLGEYKIFLNLLEIKKALKEILIIISLFWRKLAACYMYISNENCRIWFE